jgi:hypothetical protein
MSAAENLNSGGAAASSGSDLLFQCVCNKHLNDPIETGPPCPFCRNLLTAPDWKDDPKLLSPSLAQGAPSSGGQSLYSGRFSGIMRSPLTHSHLLLESPLPNAVQYTAPESESRTKRSLASALDDAAAAATAASEQRQSQSVPMATIVHSSSGKLKTNRTIQRNTNSSSQSNLNTLFNVAASSVTRATVISSPGTSATNYTALFFVCGYCC